MNGLEDAIAIDPTAGVTHQFSQAILDSFAVNIAVLNSDGIIVAVNKAWTLFAADNSGPDVRSTEIGVNYLEVAEGKVGPYAQVGQAAHLGIQAVLAGSLPEFSLEYPCHTPTRPRWFLLHVVALLEESAGSAIVSHLDITSLKQAEMRRLENAEQFQELANHLHQVFWIKDAVETRTLYVSPAYEKIWGRTCQSIYDDHRSFLGTIHPEDRDRIYAVMANQNQTGGYDEEYRILQPDGSIRWIWARDYPVRDDEGRIKRFVGIAEDVTELKAAETERARLAAIVECSEDAIISETLEGIIVSWNQGAERLYGYTAEEIIGQPIYVLFAPEDYREYLKTVEKVRKGEPIASHETVRRRKDGTKINVSLAIAPIEIRNGELVGASNVSHDITRVKQLEEQFRQSQKLEAIGRLAGGVAHDFNNLLTVIYGYTQLVLDTMPSGDSQKDRLQEVKKAGERAASLTRQLLAFSRNQVLEPKVLDLNAVVTESEKMLKRLVGEDVDLTMILDPELGRVETDPSQVEQVLMNLVINARDAMPKGGKINIETANTVLDQSCCQLHKDVQPGRYVMLAVHDTGCGMDECTKSHLFEPFFTTKELGKGTGLGLAMIHGFIKQSGGYVLVESEVNQGSTIKVYLPEVQKALRSSGELTQTIEKMPHGDETVLLVEDDEAVRTFASQVLQTCGYTILEATSGQEAIELIKRHPTPVHILVSDVVMPGICGREVAEQAKVLKPAIKVLFLSGYTDDAVIRHGILTAEVAFLQKPFTPSALAVKVRKTLDHPDASDERSPV